VFFCQGTCHYVCRVILPGDPAGEEPADMAIIVRGGGWNPPVRIMAA
jgi:hypothetical protein